MVEKKNTPDPDELGLHGPGGLAVHQGHAYLLPLVEAYRNVPRIAVGFPSLVQVYPIEVERASGIEPP